MTSSPFHFGQCQTVKEHSGQKLIQTWGCHLMTWRTSESWRHWRITNIFLDDIEKIWTWGCRCGWLVEVGGWRVYVSRGNSSRFWGDFAPCLPTSSYIAPAPIHQHSGTHCCGGGGAWRKLLVAVTGHFGDAYTEDRDLNFSPLAQSTNSQLRLFSFTWAGLRNSDLIWVEIKVKTLPEAKRTQGIESITWVISPAK